MSGHIFISYVRQDSEPFARALALQLASAGEVPWLDVLKISGGDDWDILIDAAIAGCRAFLCIVSENGAASRQARGELRRAESFQKPIIPVLNIAAEEAAPFIPRSLLTTQYVQASGRDVEEVAREIAAVVPKEAAGLPAAQTLRNPWTTLVKMGASLAWIGILAGAAVVVKEALAVPRKQPVPVPVAIPWANPAPFLVEPMPMERKSPATVAAAPAQSVRLTNYQRFSQLEQRIKDLKQELSLETEQLNRIAGLTGCASNGCASTIAAITKTCAALDQKQREFVTYVDKLKQAVTRPLQMQRDSYLAMARVSIRDIELYQVEFSGNDVSSFAKSLDFSELSLRDVFLNGASGVNSTTRSRVNRYSLGTTLLPSSPGLGPFLTTARAPLPDFDAYTKLLLNLTVLLTIWVRLGRSENVDA